MIWLLGVDGGNSKTLAAVADETGTIRGIGRAGPSNHQGIGLPPAMEQVRLAATGALDAVGIGPADVSAVSFCLAGADLPQDFDMLVPALESLALANRVSLWNDSIAILRSGTDSRDAVAIGWGAGTNGVGRNAAGSVYRLPALGWISGDWGGGGELAREAIRLVARAHDGREEPTLLTDLVLRALGVTDVDEMIARLYNASEVDFDSEDGTEWETDRSWLKVHLAPLVFQAAARGDSVACQLVERCGEEVATTATALLRNLGIAHCPADIVLGGSIFKAEGTLFLDTIRRQLAAQAPRARIVLPDVEPVVGAVFCSLDMLEIEVDRRIRRRARESYASAPVRTAEEVGA